MKKILAAALALITITSLQARKLEPWQDPNVFEENRLPMRATFVTDQQETISLNGRWRFHWSETPETRLKGFEVVAYNDSNWGEMPVPGLWELNGYGSPVYVNIGYAWRNWAPNTPPTVTSEGNHVGQYRRVFDVPASWDGKPVYLCIGSATSNVRVWINGKMVGYSEDSKLEARFDITKFVRPGINVIAMEIFRWCDGSYLEDQDFWRLSGIARGICIYTREKQRLEDVHILADADGNLKVQAEVTSGISSVKFQLADADGNEVSAFQAQPKKGKAVTQVIIDNPQLWSAEIPYLYKLKVSALSGGSVSESALFDVGFRTVEIRDAQLLVNGKPVLVKGVNRHELNQVKGYVVSEEDMIQDIRIMKELNINAVRTCHYPDDPVWLSLCDKFGLYVVDEGNIESHGMGYDNGVTLAQDHQYRAAHLIRDKRMVQRDFNHPSVIIWSLGNEAGAGPNFVDCRELIKSIDPSRPIHYERALFSQWDVSDIVCPMYASPDWCEKYVSNNPERPLIQCEYAHAMGNSVGNFKEYWDLVRKYPAYQGGFIWDFQDQALWTGKIFAFGGDFDKADPSDGSFNCNGVVAADRSWHPHAYEIRYQYQNIFTSGTPSELQIYNEFFFKDLRDVMLFWTVEADGIAVRSGIVDKLAVKPQGTAIVDLGIGSLDAIPGTLTLNLSYVLKSAWPLQPAGSQIAYDQILLRDSRPVLMEYEGGRVGLFDSSSTLVLSGTVCVPGTSAGEREALWTASFDKRTGALDSYTLERKELLTQPLMPCFNRAATENDLGARAHLKQALWRNPSFEVESFSFTPQENSCLIEVVFKPIGGKASVSVFYNVAADGSLSIVESMADAGGLSDAPDLFRFGMAFAMPASYDRIDFFGLGPWENYVDRSSAALLGRYKQFVADQYHYGYVRTQESGTHTGLRFFRVLDEGGNGFEMASATDFSASALPYSIAQLDVAAAEKDAPRHNSNGQFGVPRHPQELQPSGNTYVHVDAVQMGVGGINSWGQLPLEKYRIHAAEREFRFMLRPVVNF